jgi:hypothetical protein
MILLWAARKASYPDQQKENRGITHVFNTRFF